MTALEVLTPVADGRVIDLGNRVWRKQVLPRSSITYRGSQLEFDDDYLRSVATAFRDRAFDTVPFMLADAENRHTMDPRNAAGEVLSLEAEDDGLYATVRLSEAAEEIVRDNPKFGVSVRIKESYDRSDGRHYPAACQHVLGTFDGVVAGMKPWEAIELSQDPDQARVIDLSGLTYAEEAPTMTAPAVTNDQLLDALRGLLGPALEQEPAPADELAEFDADWTDDEFDAWTADVLADIEGDDALGVDYGDDGGDQPDYLADDHEDGEDGGEVATSQRADHGDDLVLSQVAHDANRIDALELSNRELRRERDAHQFEKERDKMVRDLGIPPHVVDLARPLLEGSGRTITLSNGDGEADAGEVIRSVLAEYAKVSRLLDLSDPVAAGRLAADDGEAEKADALRTRGREIAGGFGLLPA